MVRVVLDNCVPRTLLPHLALPDATTVGDLGWADLDDGPLLVRLADVRDVLDTTRAALVIGARAWHGLVQSCTALAAWRSTRGRISSIQ